jgi:hypothetical protein
MRARGEPPSLEEPYRSGEELEEKVFDEGRSLPEQAGPRRSYTTDDLSPLEERMELAEGLISTRERPSADDVDRMYGKIGDVGKELALPRLLPNTIGDDYPHNGKEIRRIIPGIIPARRTSGFAESWRFFDANGDDGGVPRGTYNFARRANGMTYIGRGTGHYFLSGGVNRSDEIKGGDVQGVLYAGSVRFDSGRVVAFDNDSGHFRPPSGLAVLQSSFPPHLFVHRNEDSETAYLVRLDERIRERFDPNYEPEGRKRKRSDDEAKRAADDLATRIKKHIDDHLDDLRPMSADKAIDSIAGTLGVSKRNVRDVIEDYLADPPSGVKKHQYRNRTFSAMGG